MWGESTGLESIFPFYLLPPSGFYRGFKPRRDPLAGVDLAAESELIKQKKSNLSASQRAAVVSRVEANRK
jgi:hypothetical protein